MKMTRILAVFAVATLASAPAMADFNDGTNNFWKYVWTGSTSGASFAERGNWGSVRNEGQKPGDSEYPDYVAAGSDGLLPAYWGAPGGNDWAYIGYDYSGDGTTSTFTPNNTAYNVTISGSTGAKHIFIGSASTLTVANDTTGLNGSTIHLNGGTLDFTGASTYGIKSSVTVDFGTFTVDNHGTLTMTGVSDFWGNSNTITFTGTLDLSGLVGAGSIVLADNLLSNHNDITYNYEGLISPDTDLATISMVNNQLVVNYSIPASAEDNIPEPTTATLSLLALAGLATRRRRK